MIEDGLIVFLGTEDQDATDLFYRQTLGLPLYKDQGLCRIYSVPGGGKLGFCTHMPVAKTDKSPIVTLLVRDVESVWQHLQQAGIRVPKPKVNSKFKIFHFFVRDPNGYAVEIQRFLETEDNTCHKPIKTL